MRPHIIRIINLALLFACLLIGITARVMIHVKAQGGCQYPPLASDPIKFSWAPNTSVTVEIDDTWNPSDRGAFESGIRKWNDWKLFDCSNVSFGIFNAHHFTDYSGQPPINTVYVQQHEYGTSYLGNTTQFFGGIPLRIVAVTIDIDPGQVKYLIILNNR